MKRLSQQYDIYFESLILREKVLKKHKELVCFIQNRLIRNKHHGKAQGVDKFVNKEIDKQFAERTTGSFGTFMALSILSSFPHEKTVDIERDISALIDCVRKLQIKKKPCEGGFTSTTYKERNKKYPSWTLPAVYALNSLLDAGVPNDYIVMTKGIENIRTYLRNKKGLWGYNRLDEPRKITNAQVICLFSRLSLPLTDFKQAVDFLINQCKNTSDTSLGELLWILNALVEVKEKYEYREKEIDDILKEGIEILKRKKDEWEDKELRIVIRKPKKYETPYHIFLPALVPFLLMKFYKKINVDVLKGIEMLIKKQRQKEFFPTSVYEEGKVPIWPMMYAARTYRTYLGLCEKKLLSSMIYILKKIEKNSLRSRFRNWLEHMKGKESYKEFKKWFKENWLRGGCFILGLILLYLLFFHVLLKLIPEQWEGKKYLSGIFIGIYSGLISFLINIIGMVIYYKIKSRKTEKNGNETQ